MLFDVLCIVLGIVIVAKVGCGIAVKIIKAKNSGTKTRRSSKKAK